MKCPECDFDSPDGAAECPACGLIFERWKEHQAASPSASVSADPESPAAANEPSAESSPYDQPPPQMKAFNPVVAAVILVTLLVAFGVFRWFMLHRTVVPPPEAPAAAPPPDLSPSPTSTPGGPVTPGVISIELDNTTRVPTEETTAAATPKAAVTEAAPKKEKAETTPKKEKTEPAPKPTAPPTPADAAAKAAAPAAETAKHPVEKIVPTPAESALPPLPPPPGSSPVPTQSSLP